LVVFTLLSEKNAVGFFIKPCNRQILPLSSSAGGSACCCWRGWGNTANCKNLLGNQNIARGGFMLAAATSKSTAESTQPQAASPTSQYFLLSTFAIWKSIVIKTFILFTIQIVMKTYLPRSGVSIEPVHKMCHSPNNMNWFYRLRDISLPLLSSACCALQLFLNAFFAGMGCAGFNKVLGPLRPYFVSILLFTTITAFSKHKIIQVGLAWVVALMPEFVHVVNQRMSKIHAKIQTGTLAGSASASTSTSISSALSTEEYMHRAVIELDIKDMGCVACINKIDGTLRSLGQNVIEAQSWLNTDGTKGGKARVEVGLGDLELFDVKVQEMIGLVKDAGFQCEISNVEAVES